MATITLTAGTTYQTMNGWEGTEDIGLRDFKDTFATWRDDSLDMCVYDLGINRVRLEILGGLENSTDYFTQWYNDQITLATWKTHWADAINDNADPNSRNDSGFKFAHLDYCIDNIIVPMRQRLATLGEELWVNLAFVAGGAAVGGPDTLHTGTPSEHAEFFLAAFDHMNSTYSFVPDQLDIANEPDTAKGWDATKIGNNIVAIGNRLSASGYTPDISAPSMASANASVSWFDTIIAITDVDTYLKEFAFHSYPITDGDRTAAASRRATYGVRTAMLEVFDGNGTYEALHKDLTLAEVSAWQQYVLAFPTTDNGAQYYVVDDGQSPPVVTIGSRTKYLRQYMKFVRRGAVRIAASSSDGNFESVAFINPGNKYAVVVKAATSGSIVIDNLPPATYGIKYTTASEYDIDLPVQQNNGSQSLSTSIPAAGVLTVYHKGPYRSPLPGFYRNEIYD